ncbi:TlpA family protein disulfide reductase [Sediminibacillus albus]|uniref:Thiol-disulfide isomerase or thioredoxin n=1 Tax=Sediminibacillus albus TaxID=407036 RepID=A0A1G8VW58_9BACI|nr:redoxin domain-containing protein [Sediminibacillus albus]SDJ70304.1 Thiol-disulfide isomerase or thioredoxin [Sediminibacillus albus]
MVKKFTASILLLTLIVIFIYNFSEQKNNIEESNGHGATSDSLAAGTEAPTVSLQSLEGNKEITLSDYKGKKVLLNFWATWCGPCKEEMPAMEKLKKAYGNEVEILAVNATATELEGVEKVQEFKEQANVSFTILLDKDSTIIEKYRVLNIPTSYFIGSDGKIKKTVTGPMTYEFMEQTINSMN